MREPGEKIVFEHEKFELDMSRTRRNFSPNYVSLELGNVEMIINPCLHVLRGNSYRKLIATVTIGFVDSSRGSAETQLLTV